MERLYAQNFGAENEIFVIQDYVANHRLIRHMKIYIIFSLILCRNVGKVWYRNIKYVNMIVNDDQQDATF